MSDEIAFKIVVSNSYKDAVEQVTAALKEEGFGILTRIDVKETLKEKLDQEFRPYIILGACNPPLAHRALSTDPRVGIMLPCNVTVEEHADGAQVSIANPAALIKVGDFAENELLSDVMEEAHTRLSRVAATLRDR